MVSVKLVACAVAGVSILALPACQKAANTAEGAAASATNVVQTAAAKVTNAAESVAGPRMLGPNATDAEKIESAMSAAPKAVAENATIVDMSAGGMKVLRKGTNNFTCVADAPATPGPDPMCADANAMAWIDAWTNKKTPAKGKVGFMYMLEGGTDASNTDPYATAPTEGNNWVKTGPHVMVLGSPEVLVGYPHEANPDTSRPYVMWAGTPYAHLMVPIH